jgi:hypothetical protein
VENMSEDGSAVRAYSMCFHCVGWRTRSPK